MLRVMAWTVLAAAIALPAVADRAEDDLQAVKKAVRVSEQAREKARPPVEEEKPRPEARPALRGSDLKWLHVRIEPKAGSRNGRLSVNVPLGLVRALGDDWPIPAPGCHRHDRCHLTLGELLRAVDSGQTLVDIEDDDATVKVWVE
jgi:hypothetical protein